MPLPQDQIFRITIWQTKKQNSNQTNHIYPSPIMQQRLHFPHHKPPYHIHIPIRSPYSHHTPLHKSFKAHPTPLSQNPNTQHEPIPAHYPPLPLPKLPRLPSQTPHLLLSSHYTPSPIPFSEPPCLRLSIPPISPSSLTAVGNPFTAGLSWFC